MHCNFHESFLNPLSGGFSMEKNNEEKMTGSVWFCVIFLLFSVCNGILPFYLKGKWDNKKKNKSFWQNFRKSQHKPVVRQSSKGLRASYFSTSVSWLHVLYVVFFFCFFFLGFSSDQERISATWPVRSP